MGINMNEAFPSKWLKAADIEGDTNVTISNVTMEEVGDDDRKPVVWFNEFDKGMVLNKTNANNIVELYGPDSDHWTGRMMTMATARVDFQGKSMLALRLYPPPRKVAQQSHQRPLEQTRPARETADSAPPREFAPIDDEIGF